MKSSAHLSPFFNIVERGYQKKEFMNLKVTTRGNWNDRRHFL